MPLLDCAAYEGIPGFGSADVWLRGRVFAAGRGRVIGADVGRNGADRSQKCVQGVRYRIGLMCRYLDGRCSAVRCVLLELAASAWWRCVSRELAGSAWWRCVFFEPVVGGGGASPVPPDFRVGAPALHVAQRAIRPTPATHAFKIAWLKADPAFGRSDISHCSGAVHGSPVLASAILECKCGWTRGLGCPGRREAIQRLTALTVY